MTTRQSMSKATETPTTVEAYKATYRAMIMAQRRLPLSEQWTMDGH